MSASSVLPSPVIAAPMAGGPTTPDLVRAAHAAGTFGFLAGGNLTPAALHDRIIDLRSSGTPFGVNLFVPSRTRVDPVCFAAYRKLLAPFAAERGIPLPPAATFDDDHWDAKLELLEDASVASFTFGLPDPSVVTRLRRAGTIVVVTVTTPAEARAASESGADALIVQGPRAGGHSGGWDLHAPLSDSATVDLVRAVRAVASVPLVAAGGVASASDVTALLSAGADAVQVGTLLLRTPEAGTSAIHRAALVDPRFRDTVLTRAFTGRWARSLRNAFSERFSADAPVGYPEVHRLTQPLRAAAVATADADALHLWAGTGFRAATTDSATAVLGALVRRM